MSKPESSDVSSLPLLNGFDGDFVGAIVGTFGADLLFAEKHLWTTLPSSIGSRIVLADQRELTASLSRPNSSKKLNRTYIAAGVRSTRAHHPKYIMLIGPSEGRLFVGSGNLGISGYANPGECFTVHEWRADEPESSAPFAAIRELIEALANQNWIDRYVARRCRDLWKIALWIPEKAATDSSVIHNAQNPLIDQLSARVGNRVVTELVMMAPFHDRHGIAVKQLVDRFGSGRVQLLVQEGKTRLDKIALGRVMKGHHNFQLVETALGADLSSSYIHAKFILVCTRSEDYLLQGSANLSGVALCETIEKGNVEVANLLSGKSGSFNYLLDALDLKTRSDGLKTFNADEQWSSEGTVEREFSNLQDVRWSPPILRGLILGKVPKSVAFWLNGSEIHPQTAGEFRAVEGGHEAIWYFDTNCAELIEKATALQVSFDKADRQTVFPYHVVSLARVASRKSQSDLLVQAGTLDLKDKELIELVQELDKVLIVDRESLWRTANERPATDADYAEEESEDESRRLRYEDIDWSKIPELPTVVNYRDAVLRGIWEAPDLGAVLSSLAGRMHIRDLEHLAIDEDVDDLRVEPSSEDVDDGLDDPPPEDDDKDEEEQEIRRRHSRRTRSMWKRFVKRFVRGLSDSEFVSSVGSSVIVPTYIIFNSLCQRLRSKEILDGESLNSLQLQLWAFMWGSTGRPGYLDHLPSDELLIAKRLLDENGDLPVLLAAIEDAWLWVFEMDEGGIALRRQWCRILESPHWSGSQDVMGLAATISSFCQGDADYLLQELLELASLTNQNEVIRDLADSVGLEPQQLRLTSASFGTYESQVSFPYLEITGLDLSEEQLSSLLQKWRTLEPTQQYFRVHTQTAVAIVDIPNKVSELHVKFSEIVKPLAVSDVPLPNWRIRFEELFAL